MRRDLDSICIVSLGARTALGANAPASAAAIRGAISGRAEHPYMIDKAGEPMYVSRDTLLPIDLHGSARLTALARSALADALLPINSSSIPCVVGCPEPRPGHSSAFEDELSTQLATAFGTRIAMSKGGTIAQGHTSGIIAMQAAATIIRKSESEFCVAGGVDSWLHPETLEWLDETGDLSSAENRSGFTPGEAAGFCVLCTNATATKYRLPVLCNVSSFGTATEENSIRSEGVCVGKGLSLAISEACRWLPLPAERVNFTYCDLNGQRYRSEEFTFAALRAQSYFVEVTDNLTPADCWGDIGAASGPLFAALAIASSQRGYAFGPRALLWAGSDNGMRAAALLHLPVLPVED